MSCGIKIYRIEKNMWKNKRMFVPLTSRIKMHPHCGNIEGLKHERRKKIENWR